VLLVNKGVVLIFNHILNWKKANGGKVFESKYNVCRQYRLVDKGTLVWNYSLLLVQLLNSNKKLNVLWTTSSIATTFVNCQYKIRSAFCVRQQNQF
jgi:hypothetical protein